jgi:hypothetical protein
MQSIVFTYHAFQRMGERVAICAEIIEEVLKRKLFVEIGMEGKKRHLLFYSPRDKKHFSTVTVDEGKSTVVVTVLPYEYENKFEILDAHRHSTMQMSDGVIKIINELFPPNIIFTPPTNFKIGAYLRDEQNRIKVVEIGSVPTAKFEAKFENLMNANLSEMIKEMLGKKSIFIEQVQSVFVRLGNKKTITLREW